MLFSQGKWQHSSSEKIWDSGSLLSTCVVKVARAKTCVSVEEGKCFFDKQLLSHAMAICPSQMRHVETHEKSRKGKVKNSRI